MLFSSQFFIFFFLALLFPLYYFFKSPAIRKAVLVLFSLIFYAWGEPVYVLLMIFMVAVNFLGGIIVASCRTQRSARLFLALSVAVDLAILCIFKYTAFFAESFNFVFRTSIPVPTLRMPIGISFFTFRRCRTLSTYTAAT